jgi:hypothetical protein
VALQPVVDALSRCVTLAPENREDVAILALTQATHAAWCGLGSLGWDSGEYIEGRVVSDKVENGGDMNRTDTWKRI